jgi:hypothetical protein
MMGNSTPVPIVASVSILLPLWSLPVVTILSRLPNVGPLPKVTNPRIRRVDPICPKSLPLPIFSIVRSAVQRASRRL